MITTDTRAGHTFRMLAIVLIMAAVGLVTSATAQSLRTVSYQGLLKNGSSLMNGTVTMTIAYYEAGSTTPLMTETFPEVLVSDGTFNILLGSRLGGFPESIDFSVPIEIGVSIDGAAELPHSLLTAVPYAFAAHTIDGLLASSTPANNRIFPLPVDANGHIGPSVLPTVSINGVNAINNNLRLSAGQNVTLTPDYANNQLVISTAVGSISSVTVGQGMLGGGTNGAINVGLNPGQVPGNWLTPGSVTGHQLNSAIAGPGLQMDVNGNLGLLVDAANFTLTGGELHLRHDVPVFGPSGTFDVLTGNSAVLGNGYESTVTIDGPTFVHAPLDMGGYPINNVADPYYSSDAATKAYVDARDAMRPWLNQAEILVGNLDNIAENRTMAGDATIDWLGQVTVRGLQGYAIENMTPQDGNVLRFDGESNAWYPTSISSGQLNSVVPGVGISVNSSDPQNPVVSLASFIGRNIAGSIQIVNGGAGDAEQASTTISNPNVHANSIIQCTVVWDANSVTNEHYMCYVSDISNGSFMIHLNQAAGKLKSGEGCTIHYVIFN